MDLSPVLNYSELFNTWSIPNEKTLKKQDANGERFEKIKTALLDVTQNKNTNPQSYPLIDRAVVGVYLR